MKILYTKDHEWVVVEKNVATVGISAYAAEQMGDVVFVELPEQGRELEQGDDAAVVESVKAASEVYAPLDGVVVAVNEELTDNPSQVNDDPEGEGWFYKIRLADPDQVDGLFDADDYQSYLETLD